ncbi:MAG: hypothetical protein MJ072_03215 [Clostridia bacterium]|nr:hypothetical protein [Clostridia bacterium]
MKGNIISLISDVAFTVICAFFVGAVISSYFFKMPVNLILSVLFSFAVGTGAFFILKKRAGKRFLSRQEEKFKEKVLDQLCFMTEDECENVVKNAYLLIGDKVNKTGKGYVVNGDKRIFTLFSFGEITPADVATVYSKKKENETAYVFARNFSPATLSFTAKLDGVKTFNGDETFLILKSANYYPEIKIVLNEKKLTVKGAIKDFFLKTNAKGFFFTGLTLLFLSFLTPFKLYYVIFGTVFICFSIFTIPFLPYFYFL